MSWAGAVGGGAGVRFALGPSLSLDLGGDLVKLGELAFVGSAVASQESTEDPAVLRLRAGLRFGG